MKTLVHKYAYRFHNMSIHKRKVAEFHCEKATIHPAGFCTFSPLTDEKRTKNCPAVQDRACCWIKED